MSSTGRQARKVLVLLSFEEIKCLHGHVVLEKKIACHGHALRRTNRIYKATYAYSPFFSRIIMRVYSRLVID
jgi:hypothetical protein